MTGCRLECEMEEKIRKIIRKGRIIALATASKDGKPDLICVECCGLFDNKILIADCQFNKTLLNLKDNSQVSIMISNGKDYFQIKGKAEYFTSGKWFDKVTKINEGTEYKPKGALLVSCEEIYDLNKCEKVV